MPLDPEGLFFIVGTGRCGTTLLQAMLIVPPEALRAARAALLRPARAGRPLQRPLKDEDVEGYLALFRSDVWCEDMGVDAEAFAQAVRGACAPRGTSTCGSSATWPRGAAAPSRGAERRRRTTA
jgi:hypothetical protein